MRMRRERRVVVTGMGIVCAIGGSVPAFLDALRAGRSGVAGMPDERPGPPAAALITDFDWSERLAALQARHATTGASCARVMRTASRGLRITAAATIEAAEQAGLLEEGAPPPERTGIVVAGSNLDQQAVFENGIRYEREPAYVQPRYGYRFFDSAVASALSAILPIQGLGWTTGAGAASGGVAILQAMDAVRSGRVDRCLAVGAMATFSPVEWEALARIGALVTGREELPPEAWCRPFDARATGFVPGEGAAAVIVEELEAASERGAAIQAELLAAELVLEGTDDPAPTVAGEIRAMEGVLRLAAVDPAGVGYVNAHATSTRSGDAAECEAIRQALGSRPFINATKALTGHTMFAAGVVELIAVVLQLGQGFLHGNPWLDDPIAADLRFVGTEAAETGVDLAISNAFGFGGINSSLLVRAWREAGA